MKYAKLTEEVHYVPSNICGCAKRPIVVNVTDIVRLTTKTGQQLQTVARMLNQFYLHNGRRINGRGVPPLRTFLISDFILQDTKKTLASVVKVSQAPSFSDRWKVVSVASQRENYMFFMSMTCIRILKLRFPKN